MKKQILSLSLACILALSPTVISYADQTSSAAVTMENCGAYIFEWRPVDCGNGYYFAIIVGADALYESDVILNRGYDYAYGFDSNYTRTWGQIPKLVNVNGVWAIPENQAGMPEGTQPTLRITLRTNNNVLPTKERFVDVVSLPSGVRTSELPPEVRKYLINADGSDAGAYEGTVTAGWDETDGSFRYRKPDGTYITNSWLKLEDKEYYMGEDGVMLSDTITPDGIYVNANGEKTTYIPGWTEVDGEKRYVMKSGYYVSNGWQQDTDGKYYYFNMACRLLTNTTTPDGYYVGEDGAWDGNPSTSSTENPNLGPGGAAYAEAAAMPAEGWEKDGDSWKYRLEDGNYVTNGWKQTDDGKWYYFNESALMLADTDTPDGYHVGADGAWVEQVFAE